MSTRVTNPADGSLVSAAVGRTVEIDFPENPTTGYLWHADYDHADVTVESTFALRGDALGAGGTRSFRVTPLRVTGARITFSLGRPNATHAAESRVLTLEVSG